MIVGATGGFKRLPESDRSVAGRLGVLTWSRKTNISNTALLEGIKIFGH